MPPSLRVHAYTYGGVPPDALHANVILWPTSAAERSALTWALSASAGADPAFRGATFTGRGAGARARAGPRPGDGRRGGGAGNSKRATTAPARAPASHRAD